VVEPQHALPSNALLEPGTPARSLGEAAREAMPQIDLQGTRQTARAKSLTRLYEYAA